MSQADRVSKAARVSQALRVSQAARVSGVESRFESSELNWI